MKYEISAGNKFPNFKIREAQHTYDLEEAIRIANNIAELWDFVQVGHRSKGTSEFDLKWDPDGKIYHSDALWREGKRMKSADIHDKNNGPVE